MDNGKVMTGEQLLICEPMYGSSIIIITLLTQRQQRFKTAQKRRKEQTRRPRENATMGSGPGQTSCGANGARMTLTTALNTQIVKIEPTAKTLLLHSRFMKNPKITSARRIKWDVQSYSGCCSGLLVGELISVSFHKSDIIHIKLHIKFK